MNVEDWAKLKRERGSYCADKIRIKGALFYLESFPHSQIYGERELDLHYLDKCNAKFVKRTEVLIED